MKLPSQPRAVLTGAGSGFGRAFALVLAERRARLVLSDVDEGKLAETAELARAAGAETVAQVCDVADAEAVEALALAADEHFSGTDLLVNNAGVAVAGKVGEVPLSDWRWQLDINLNGVIHGCHAFIPRMRAAGSGHILNVASSAGLLSAPMMAPYNVSKAGVIALSETLYAELEGSGVGVTALCPTFFRTSLHETARSPNPDELRDAEKLITEAKWTAEEIAVHALRGIEADALYVIPQADGKALWLTKRLLGQKFHGLLGKVANSDFFARFLR